MNCNAFKYIIKKSQDFILSSENVQKKIDSLMIELQKMTGVSNEELDEFKKILDLADFSQDQE